MGVQFLQGGGMSSPWVMLIWAFRPGFAAVGGWGCRNCPSKQGWYVNF
ncbi:MAG: hypothetical protein ACD_23C00865G0002 [uncultured bacterium]|nr:MAG: hypothetical protein ACD_23C00865G0002 [uncultured bacterium]